MQKKDVVKTIRFRILPSAAQEGFFRRYEGVCCMLWNAGIDYQNQRRRTGLGLAKWGHGYVGFKDKDVGFAAQWKLLRADSDFSYLRELHSETCRHIFKRLDDSYKAAFKGIRGYPSYSRRADFCSFTVPGGLAKVADSKLRIPGAGSAKSALFIKMRPRRGMDKVDLGGGEITDVIIKREGENVGGAARWFAYIQCKYKNTVIPAPKEGAVGVDANVGNAAVWDGESGDIIRLPDELVLQARRRRYQRVMSRKQHAALKTVGWNGKSETRKTAQSALGKRRAEKIRARVAELTAGGLEEWQAREIAYAEIPYISKKYAAVKIRAAKASRNIAGVRGNWTHHASRKIADSAGLIVLEDLQLQNMTKSAKGNKKKPGKNVRAKAGLNCAMLASCHGMLKRRIVYKAEWGGGRVEKVGAAYTSQTCAKCGVVNKKSRRATERFKCVHCGHADNAQINAAKNILHKFMLAGKGEKPSARGDGGGNPKRPKRAGSRSVKRETPMKQKAKTAGAAVKQPDKSQRGDLPFV